MDWKTRSPITPDIGVMRKNRAGTGLIRYDRRNETRDWPQVIREIDRRDQAEFIVMMVGLNDRLSFRDRARPRRCAGASPRRKPAASRAPAAPAPPSRADAEPDAGCRAAPPELPAVAAPEPQPKGGATRPLPRLRIPHRRMGGPYTKRIDATIAALKSEGVPVFWVGLPSMRGPKATSDMQYLNDLYRGRAEKAGITYVDVWDGFVDDSGRFTIAGPRLRRPDPAAARRRRRALHQGRRAQARALSSSAKSAA